MDKFSSFFKSIVMTFQAGKTIIKNQPITKVKKQPQNNLSQQEIALILGIIKTTTFKGENIEALYNLVHKLQNQYTNLDK